MRWMRAYQRLMISAYFAMSSNTTKIGKSPVEALSLNIISPRNLHRNAADMLMFIIVNERKTVLVVGVAEM